MINDKVKEIINLDILLGATQQKLNQHQREIEEDLRSTIINLGKQIPSMNFSLTGIAFNIGAIYFRIEFIKTKYFFYTTTDSLGGGGWYTFKDDLIKNFLLYLKANLPSAYKEYQKLYQKTKNTKILINSIFIYSDNDY